MPRIAILAGVAAIALASSPVFAQNSFVDFNGGGSSGSGGYAGSGGGSASGAATGGGGGGGGGGTPGIVNNNTANAGSESASESVSGASNLGNTQAINFGGSEASDLGDAVPNVVVPSVIGNGACAGAGFSAGLGVSGLGIGVGANSIDEDCTIREYVTLMYNMCAASPENQTWCMVADRMLLNEVDMINRAWNDVNNPPPPPAPVATAAPVAAPVTPVVTEEVIVPVAAPAVNCPPTAPNNAGELTRLFAQGCRWN